MNDLKKDVMVHKNILRDSEDRRQDLQIHITQTSIVIHSDTDEHRQYQESLIAEAEMLRGEVQALKQHHARREQEFLHTLEDVNQAQNTKVELLTADHHSKFTSLSNESQDKIERL